MEWNRSDVIALASSSCTTCMGYGVRNAEYATGLPCKCVFRAIFRACYAKFRYCTAMNPHVSTARLEHVSGAVNGPRIYGRKNEEYVADFCAISRRVLENQLEYKLFRFHFLLGADWKLCSRQLKMNRGDFFHAVYRIEQKLGRAYRELKPYGLYPLNEYFGGSVSTERMKACIQPKNGNRALRAPLKVVEMELPPVYEEDQPLAA